MWSSTTNRRQQGAPGRRGRRPPATPTRMSTPRPLSTGNQLILHVLIIFEKILKPTSIKVVHELARRCTMLAKLTYALKRGQKHALFSNAAEEEQ